MSVKFKKYIKAIIHGWRDAGEIALMQNVNKGRIAIYFDMIGCLRRYNITHSQYKDRQFYNMSEEERNRIGYDLKAQNDESDLAQTTYDKNWKFLCKYTSMWYEASHLKRHLRLRAYAKRFGFGSNCQVQYGVMINFEHLSVGNLVIGKNVLFARNSDVDYTGDLTIGNGVIIMEGAKILTHTHDYFYRMRPNKLKADRAMKTNLEIKDNARIGAHSVIMPGVKVIGENSIIQAGSIVMNEVPDNVIVGGNPATVIGTIPAGVKMYVGYPKHK